MRNNIIGICTLSFGFLFIWGCTDDPVSPEPDSEPKTIQELVNAASPGDTITLDAGVYSTLHEHTDFIGRTFLVFCVMKPGVVVRGATGDPADVVIDAGGEGLGFWFHETGNSTGLGDLTVRNALWGISGYDASPWINNCIIENNGNAGNNSWSAGTGMYFDRSTSVVTNCIFRNNQAASGAGATFSTSSDVRFEECIFTENHSSISGGGVSVGNKSMAVFVNCSITDNTAGENGGGISSNGYSLVVSGGIISGNSAGSRGGGCEVRDGVLGVSFDNVVIVDNSAPEGSQGYVGDYSGEVSIVCCETNPEDWMGEVTFDNSNCEKEREGGSR